MDEAQLLEELQKLLEPDEEDDGGGHTVHELSVRWDTNPARVRELIKAGIGSDLVEMGTRRGRRIDGKVYQIPVYRIKNDE